MVSFPLKLLGWIYARAHNCKANYLYRELHTDRHAMPNDAKLALILGIGLVVLIGIVFFRAEPGEGGNPPPPTTSVNAVQTQPDTLVN